MTGDLRLNTATGDITIDRALADVTAKTAYGRIRASEMAGGSVRLETGYGKAHIGIAEGTAAWLDTYSKSGVVRNTLTARRRPRDRRHGRRGAHAHQPRRHRYPPVLPPNH